MFRKLFKPKWQSAKPHVRIQAIAHLNADNSDDLKIIELLAKNDVDADVRLAAVIKIKDQQALTTIAQLEKNPQVRTKIIEHLVSQLPQSGNADQLGSDMETLINDLDAQALAAIVETTKSAPLGLLALQHINDEALLQQYALSLPLAALRTQAVEKISDETVLEAIEKATKGKDKSVFRIARNKLNQIRETLQQEENLEQQIDSVCRNMEQLARGSDDPMWQTKVAHWHKQWTRVEMHASADDSQRFNRAYELCRQQVIDAEQEENAIKEQVQQQRQALQERMAACEQLESALQQLKAAPQIKAEDVPALTALLTTQATRWEEAAETSRPAADERKRFNRAYSVLEKVLKSVQLLNDRSDALSEAANAVLEADDATAHELAGLKKALDKAYKDLQWPGDFTLPDVLVLVKRANAVYETARKKAQQKESEAIGRLKELLQQLDQAINDGSLKLANKTLAEAQKWEKHIPNKSVQKFQKELRDYSARVNELRDWQGFAITPKKEQLCVDMEALINADIDPQELANRIKRLQTEWKSLGHSKDSQPLWERFSEAAEKAYEPCKGYFENLSEIRYKNLEARKAIVEQLQGYLQNFNFDQADWVVVNQVYETAKREWRDYTPVERKEGKSVQEQFNGLLDNLRGKLNEEFERNKGKREELIAQAEALAAEAGLSNAELKNAIEEAKRLQRCWKETGLVARRDENKLWKRFRSACDKIFERRDSERQAVSEERDKNLAEANHIIELIEHLSESESLSYENSQKEFRELQKRFADVGTMPKDKYEEAHKRYKAVCNDFQADIKAAKAAAKKAEASKIWQIMARLDAFEAQCISGEKVEPLADEIVAVLESDAATNIDLPGRYQQLKAISEGAVMPTDDQLADNTHQLRSLCIQLEIAAGVESPAEDQSTRMELQVSRLTNGFGHRDQAEQDVSRQIIKLLRQWCQVGAVPAGERARYSERFKSVLTQIGEL
ncbi:MAG: hypothetical protein CSA49_03505 [Gammaproteobacteria bacterium]|nr:MAG: hypothetical protein CSA49_03505 [Gammaproteobacteria bacterium]